MKDVEKARTRKCLIFSLFNKKNTHTKSPYLFHFFRFKIFVFGFAIVVTDVVVSLGGLLLHPFHVRVVHLALIFAAVLHRVEVGATLPRRTFTEARFNEIQNPLQNCASMHLVLKNPYDNQYKLQLDSILKSR